MQVNWQVLHAMQLCPYKAWLLAKEKSSHTDTHENCQDGSFFALSGTKASIVIPAGKITPNDKFAIAAWCMDKSESIEIAQINFGVTEPRLNDKSTIPSASIRLTQYSKKAQKLLATLKEIISKEEPPPFYRNPHCPECQFKDSCYKKLKERDCISLLPGMSAKVLAKYHNKGMFTITQLSYIFRPRRRGRRPQNRQGSYLWDLKALAIREQKTFVMYPPDLEKSSTEIFIDFEGLPEEGRIYLIGVVLKEEGRDAEFYSYWANDKAEEEHIFQKLLDILIGHPDVPIYHYGSYESKALKQAAKKCPGIFEHELPEIERRLVNVLSYLRTHVYPPTYGNGLKEVAGFLGFQWRNQEADGVLSMKWRKDWETSRDDILKEKLLQYNLDDCNALVKVSQWLLQLTADSKQDGVQRVADMRNPSPFKFKSNPEFGADFNVITKASYFNYQQSKIYWRNQRNSKASPFQKKDEKRHLGRGKQGWNPKKVNEVIVIPKLKRCPKCGHKKLYDCLTHAEKWRQTDLKFTPSGIKQWVVEYRSTQVKCAACWRHFNNGVVRRPIFGDNLFAWATNLYVTYHISHEMISRLLEEQFGIWAFRQYFVDRQHKWWDKWQPEVDYLWEIVRQSPVIHIDETTVKLSKDRGYVWIFATPHTVFYHFTLTRETDFLQEWLKGYEGVIVTDSFAGYETLKLKQQKCLIHVIRDLNDDLFKNPFDEQYKALKQQTPEAKAQRVNTMKSGSNFFYVGTTPHDTLVVTGNWQNNGPVAVINDGVLIFNNAHATISGSLIVVGHGQVLATNSYFYFPQQYFYQWGLEGDGNGLLQMRHCTLDFNQFATPWGMSDSATFNFQNVYFTSSASTIGLNGHANFIVDTANLLGEIVATDTILLSLKNVDTVIVWHHIQRGAGLTWSFPNGYNLQHYAIGPDSTGVNGLPYTIELDNIKQVHWALMPENLTNVNISNSTIRSVAVIYKGLETGTAQGLVDNSTYVTSPTFFSDRTFQLSNCTVQTWGVYPTDTTYVDITSCILGEIGTSGHSHTSCSSMFADGTGGYFWANGFGFQSASGCGFTCPVRAEQGGTVLVGFSSISAATGYAIDSGLLIMVQTPTISPPIAYDGSDIWVGMLPPQTLDSGYIQPLTGSAYILRGPTSNLMSFASYYVAYQLSGTNTWTITDSVHTSPVTEGTLVNWNTTGIATGHYNMQMIIKDNFGDSVTVASGLSIVIGTPGPSSITNITPTDFNIYPNPTTGQLFIQTGSTTITGVNIYNSNGQLIYQSTQLQNQTINVSNLASGVYVIEILSNDGGARRRWVKM